MRRSRKGESDLLAGSFTGRWERLLSRRVLGGIAAVVVILPGLFVVGEYLQRYVTYQKARAGDPSLKPAGLTRPMRDMLLNALYEIPFPWRTSRLLRSGLPVYDLRIARKDLAALQRTAELVSARSTAGDVIPREYVPARFRADDEWVPVQVKLRGVYAYHYLKKRPSLRIKFPKERLFHGKRRINLIEPYDKGLTADLTNSWELRHYGILTYESQFVIVRLNGEVLGLYYEIEQFGRSIADREGRSEGYIFSGHGQLFGTEGGNYAKARRAIDLVVDCYRDDGTPPPEHCSDWRFVRDHFDTDRWAWAAALTALLNSKHAWAPDNLRLFWDPARGRFEPIPWDYGSFGLDPSKHPDGEIAATGYLAEPMLSIPEFRRMRDRRLWTLLTERVEAMVAHASAAFEELRPALVADIRHLRLQTDIDEHELYVKDLTGNRDFLTELFRRHDLRARFWRTPCGLRAELRNHGKAFLSVQGIRVEDGGAVRIRRLGTPLRVDGLWRGEPGQARVDVALPDGVRVVGLDVRNEVTGAELAPEEIAVERKPGDPVPPPLPAAPEPPLRIALDRVRVEPERVTFGPGRVRLDRPLSIPASHDVVFAAGLELEMGSGASLFVYGDLEARGSALEPIRVFGRPDWGGLFVQGTRLRPSRVHLEHAIIEGGTGGENQRTRFSGAFSVHDGVVVLRSSQFRNAAAEDGINLKYSNVRLEQNLFLGSADDSVDCDFCTGEVRNNRVVDSGGDALDFSGSEVLVKGNVITRCADKGMSVGERSTLVIEDNAVTACTTGVAVKDLSHATIRNSRLSELDVGIALYVKKLSFGPSTARVRNVEMRDVASSFLHDSRCTLEVLPEDPSDAAPGRVSQPMNPSGGAELPEA